MLKHLSNSANTRPVTGHDVPLRILLASYRSHPHVGGQGVYVYHLSKALHDLGHKVDVASGPPYPNLAPGIGLVKLPSLDLFAEDNAFSAIRSKHFSSWSDLSEWLSHNSGAFGEPYAFGRRLHRFILNNPRRYDVVHDNQTLARALLKIRKTVPVVTTLHHPISIDLKLALQSEKRWWMRALIRRWHRFVRMQAKVARRLNPILTVSDASKQAAMRDFGVPAQSFHIVPNGVDQSVFYPDANIAREDNMIVTTASADTPLKGLPVLIRAFAELADAFPKLRLVVIGRLRNGPTKDAIKAAGLSERIEFRSGIDQSEIADLFRKATIMVSPSLFEGFGMPAAEAMACAAPLIVSTGGALPEVAGDAGLITPKGDAPALAAAIRTLLQDPAQRTDLGNAALKRAQDVFSWPRHAQGAVSLYRQALEAHAHH
ncbi:MAG: glycosyl transferase [Robiginitomaculum sp.]|nr:MAG: glycosyl transferase [Robiginitomaculum sp.]